MKPIKFIQITPEELIELISNSIEKKFQELKQSFQPQTQTEYLNREEVAKWLQVDVSTIHNWRKAGKISVYGIGGKRLYKRQEIEDALIKMKN